METTLAILMILGIFVGIPAVIGFTIAGAYTLSDHQVRRDQHAQALEEAITVTQEAIKELKPVA